MVRLKRVAAVLLALPLVHLNVARAAIACDRHDEDHPAPAAANAHVVHATHGTLDHVDHVEHVALAVTQSTAPDDQRPSGDAASTECCQALTSCSFAFGAADGQSLPGVAALQRGRLAPAADIPPSRINTPEPPPPKA